MYFLAPHLASGLPWYLQDEGVKNAKKLGIVPEIKEATETVLRVQLRLLYVRVKVSVDAKVGKLNRVSRLSQRRQSGVGKTVKVLNP